MTDTSGLWMLLFDDGDEDRDWRAEMRTCKGCGRDSYQDEADAEMQAQYAMCAQCVEECEQDRRCWICGQRGCVCGEEGEAGLDR